jgi:hypothetical protein
LPDAVGAAQDQLISLLSNAQTEQTHSLEMHPISDAKTHFIEKLAVNTSKMSAKRPDSKDTDFVTINRSAAAVE